MASQGRGRRGCPRGSSRPPLGFDQQAFIVAMGAAAATIAQASAVGSQGGPCDAPKPEGPLTTRQPAKNLYVACLETHT